MVVAPEAHATRAGVRMLEAGGNAVDAAVAAAFALGVTQPQSTGIGGGAFLVVHLADGRSFALDARETAPAASTPDMYVGPGVPERASFFGGLAVGTPGMVAGLALALERWGTKSLAEALEPAIELAEEGYPVGAYQLRFVARMRTYIEPRFPKTAAIQFPPEGEVEPGWRLVQSDLGRTLRRIAREGPAGFYQGPVAEAIAKEVARTGGVLSVEDLAAYEPVVREPVRGTYRGLEVLSFPPPSSGGIALIEMLNILEGFDLRALGAGSSASVHRVAEAMKLAFADRAAWLGDPDFTHVPVAELTSKDYASELRARINPPWWRRAPWTWHRTEVAIEVAGPGIPLDDRGTAHLSTIDAAGNAVALTGTINGPFGSGVTAPGTGVLLNNEMDDFVTDPEAPNFYGLVGVGDANHVQPGKRPLSSMTPTVVLDEGRVRLVLGSNGGPRIITAVLLALLQVVDWEADVMEAVSEPRFHQQWRPVRLQLEAAFPEDVAAGLRARGWPVERVDELTTGVQAIAVDPETGLRTGGNDPRRDGLALGR